MGDEHWVAGYLYINPRDSRLIVPWRGGRGHVLNCGRPLGLALTILSIGLPTLGTIAFLGSLAWQFQAIGLLIGLPVTLVSVTLAAMLAAELRP